jgi:hypothetical protein
MNAGARLAAFAAALAVVLGGGAAAGALIKPDAPGGAKTTSRDAGKTHMNNNNQTMHGDAANGTAVHGLAVAQDGLRLEIDTPELRQDVTGTLRFRIVDDGSGAAVRDFAVGHTKRMHVIVVRRDLTGFRHLHPTMDRNGTWVVPLKLRDPGSYRVFADFARGDRPATLAGDLRVDGSADLKPLPDPEPVAWSDDYEVRLESGWARAGRERQLRFTVSKDGHAIHVEPYLGADGHLVALRAGDLAFLHVHPVEGGHGTSGRAQDDAIRFEATFPTAGAYRLFLQFKHDGRVHTVAFTEVVS